MSFLHEINRLEQGEEIWMFSLEMLLEIAETVCRWDIVPSLSSRFLRLSRVALLDRSSTNDPSVTKSARDSPNERSVFCTCENFRSSTWRVRLTRWLPRVVLSVQKYFTTIKMRRTFIDERKFLTNNQRRGWETSLRCAFKQYANSVQWTKRMWLSVNTLTI